MPADAVQAAGLLLGLVSGIHLMGSALILAFTWTERAAS